MDKNDKVLKSKNNNYKKYNNIRNYEGRNYSPEYLETLYANYNFNLDDFCTS